MSQLNMFSSTSIDTSKCTVIYRPSGRAGEYAALACNVYTGCDHGCVYCYAPSATHKPRDFFSKPTVRNGSFLTNLEKDATLHQSANTQEHILLSFTCDPYQNLDRSAGVTRRVLHILREHNLRFCVLTKGGGRALRDLDMFTPQDAFATTLTCLSESESVKWEPGAALPTERLIVLEMFKKAGIPTWVSLEPVLNPEVALEIIRRTHEYVDLYKVGKLNYHSLASTINWRKFGTDIIGLLNKLGKTYYIKQDLMQHLV